VPELGFAQEQEIVMRISRSVLAVTLFGCSLLGI
jgi:hypothetical protein